jgi:hypothetical protein
MSSYSEYSTTNLAERQAQILEKHEPSAITTLENEIHYDKTGIVHYDTPKTPKSVIQPL